MRLTRRASRMNLAGFPNDSRYMRISRTSGSSSQYSSRSLPEMSVLFPMLTNMAMPSPSERAFARIASPSAPLCETNAAPPRSGRAAANVAFRRTSGCVLMTPMQFGPTILMP